MANFSEIFPPIETALDLEPEELAVFVLKHLGPQDRINRYNYTIGTSPDLVEYAGDYQKQLIHQLMEAWMWLERELFIAPSPGSQGDWAFITRRGRQILESEDFQSYQKASLLPAEDLDPILVRKVRPLFVRGDYETAVFQAFKEVEVRVRKKAGLPDSAIGQKLMRDAFQPNGGPLTNMKREAAERQGVSDLFAGAIALFKNPSSHRDIDFSDPKEVADLIHFANVLLRITDRKT